jgi:hypothetical protein
MDHGKITAGPEEGSQEAEEQKKVATHETKQKGGNRQ